MATETQIVVEYGNPARRYSDGVHRTVVAYRSGAGSSGGRFGRERVPARAGELTCAGPKFPLFELRHIVFGRVVRGSLDLARSLASRALDKQFGFGPLADARRLLQRFGIGHRISRDRNPAGITSHLPSSR